MSSSVISEFVESIEAKLPEVATPQQLIDLGLFPSRFAMAQRRQRGDGPRFIKLGGRSIFYPKRAVLEWLNAQAEASGKNYAKNSSDIDGSKE